MYLKKKPNDPRCAAVMTLGGQALKVAKRHLYLHTDKRIHTYRSLAWLRKDPTLD
jgi:hypothetical protein